MPWEHLAPQLRWTMAGVFGVLMLASVIVAALSRRFPERDWTELQQRVRTWWVMIAVFSIAMVLSRMVSLVFFAMISFLALKEYLSMIPTRRADRRVLFWAYLAIPLQYWWVAQQWYVMFLVFIPVFVFLFLPMRMVMIGETQGFLSAIGTVQWGVMITVFCLSHIAYLLVVPAAGSLPMPAAGAGPSSGPALVLFLVILTQGNDIMQYVFGKLFGSHKITPTVSPRKTVEGWLGGLASTVLLAVLLAPWLTPLDRWHAVCAGLLIGGAGFVGDVTISAVKRDLGRKDAGSLLPGHGGILDRVDSLIYTAPLFFHYIAYLYF